MRKTMDHGLLDDIGRFLGNLGDPERTRGHSGVIASRGREATRVERVEAQ